MASRMTATVTDPSARVLGREIEEIRREVELLKRAGRTTQLQASAVMGNGSIPFYDGDGVLRLVLGQQSDGGYAIKTPVAPTPPPRPNTPDVVPFPSGLGISWNGEFITGSTPSDFKQVEVYLGSSPTFIASKDNFVGTLRAAGGIPVAPLDTASTYYAMFIATNTAEKDENTGTGERPTASIPSLVASGKPAMTVAQQLLDGIVDELALADGAVKKAKLAVNSVDGTKIEPNSISSPLIVAESILATHIALNQILAEHMTADSITGREIKALSILADHIQTNQIDAGHIKAGAVTAAKMEADMVIAKRIIAGDILGARLELHPTFGLQAYTASGQRTIWVDAATGNVDIVGSLQAGSGAVDRLVVQPAGDGVPSMYFYANPDPIKPAYINAVSFGSGSTFRNAIGMNSGPSVDTGTSPYQATMFLHHDLIRLFCNTAPGNSRGTNQLAGGYIGISPTVVELATSAQATGIINGQFIMSATDSYWRTCRTNNTDSTIFRLRPNEIIHEVIATDGTTRNGGFIWLRRGTGDTYMGHLVQGSTDSFIKFEGASGDVQIAAGNSQIRINENGAIEFYENGLGRANLADLKAFVIPHPSPAKRESHYLVHGCTESPWGGVEYWGEGYIAAGDNGTRVHLPEYFEDLCADDHRSVQLTQVMDDPEFPLFVQLAASPITDGAFTVYSSLDGPIKFTWLVKARREAVDFNVEPDRSTVTVVGDGPYKTVIPN